MDLNFSPPLYQLVEAFLRARGSPRAGGPQPIEKGQKEFTIIYLFFQDLSKCRFFDDKGKQKFAIYFTNVDLLMIKGKHLFVIFQGLARICVFYVLGFITLFIS